MRKDYVLLWKEFTSKTYKCIKLLSKSQTGVPRIKLGTPVFMVYYKVKSVTAVEEVVQRVGKRHPPEVAKFAV